MATLEETLDRIRKKLKELKKESEKQDPDTTLIDDGLDDVDSDCTSALALLSPPDAGAAFQFTPPTDLTVALGIMHTYAEEAYAKVTERNPDVYIGDRMHTIKAYVPYCHDLNQ